MAILLLTRNRFLYASRRLLQEAAARGIAMRALDPCDLPAAISPDGVAIGGEKIERALLRFGASSRAESLLAAETLESSGVEVINAPSAARLASSKISSALVMAKAGLPVLESRVIYRANQLAEAADALGGFPLVAKREFGSQGEGVFLLESSKSAPAIIASLLKEGPLVLQRFIAEANGSDIRYLVLDGAILAGVARDGRAGDFRANFHQGATLSPWLEDAGAEIAVKAVAALGMRFAGVDLIRSKDGLRILEVNASAGFRGVEEACGVSVAGALVAHFCAKPA